MSGSASRTPLCPRATSSPPGHSQSCPSLLPGPGTHGEQRLWEKVKAQVRQHRTQAKGRLGGEQSRTSVTYTCFPQTCTLKNRKYPCEERDCASQRIRVTSVLYGSGGEGGTMAQCHQTADLCKMPGMVPSAVPRAQRRALLVEAEPTRWDGELHWASMGLCLDCLPAAFWDKTWK